MPLAKKEQRLLIIGRKRGCHTLDIGIQNKTKSWRSPGLGGKSQQSTNDKQRPYCQKAGYQNTSEIRLTCMTCTCGKRITEIQVDLGLCMGDFWKHRLRSNSFRSVLGTAVLSLHNFPRLFTFPETNVLSDVTSPKKICSSSMWMNPPCPFAESRSCEAGRDVILHPRHCLESLRWWRDLNQLLLNSVFSFGGVNLFFKCKWMIVRTGPPCCYEIRNQK